MFRGLRTNENKAKKVNWKQVLQKGNINSNKLLQSDLFLCPTWWKSDAKDVVFTMISNISIIQRHLRKLIAMLWDETAFQDLIIFFRYKPVMHVDSIFIQCFYGPSNFVSNYFQNSAEPGVKTRCSSVPAAHYHPRNINDISCMQAWSVSTHLSKTVTF